MFGFTTRSPYSPSNLAASATSLDLAKHRAKYLAEKVRVIKPARPETMARLKRTMEEIRKHSTEQLVKKRD